MEAGWALAGINSGHLGDIVQQDKIIPWVSVTVQLPNRIAPWRLG